MNTHVRDNLNETAPGVASAAGRMIVTDAANSIVERLPAADEVLTSETTTSTTYTDLATAGPAVTVTTGTAALVIVTASVTVNTDGGVGYISFAVSGATTQAAADSRSLNKRDTNNRGIQASFVIVETDLNAGSNTFTLKYRTSAGTATFVNRVISVVPF
jgi:hypothetical protein